MLRTRSTKIIATVGYASQDMGILKKLVLAGVDVFRLNFSHGDHATHTQVVEKIRLVEKELAFPLGIIVDLQGPKLRIGKFASSSVRLEEGDAFTLDLSSELGTKERVTFPHASLYPYIKPGSILLLNDGNIRLHVNAVHEDRLLTQVISGGTLSDNKGVNLPHLSFPISPLTDKDRADLKCIEKLDIDFIALSFVQKAEDIKELRALIPPKFRILAKIEKPMALNHLDAILQEADGLMVARGDLGIEMDVEHVPSTQKRLIELSKKYGKTVIVATQMLESMISSPTPTRAEVSDVANAVYETADCVMLSAESAVGQHPIKVVEMMNRIIETTEKDGHYQKIVASTRPLPYATIADAITLAAKQVADTLNAPIIATFTASGGTAIRASRQRPLHPILSLTRDITTARLLTLYWGVYPYIIHEEGNLRLMINVIAALCVKEGYAKKGDPIVITGGDPMGEAGKTNFVHVKVID